MSSKFIKWILTERGEAAADLSAAALPRAAVYMGKLSGIINFLIKFSIPIFSFT